MPTANRLLPGTSKPQRAPILLVAAFLLLVSGCSQLVPERANAPEEDWPEVFEFELRPGDLVGDDLDRAVVEFDPMGGDLVPGSARHLATVDAPSGRTDFFRARFVNLPDEMEMPGGQVICTMMRSDDMGSASCGSEPDFERADGLREEGLGASETWQQVEFSTSDETVKVVGVTDDGTEYTVIPLNGRGYAQWRFDRGFMQLTALDADGNELESITVGMPRCEVVGRC